MSALDLSIDAAMRSINAELGKKKVLTLSGLLKGGLVVQRLAQERVPVQYGELKQSASARVVSREPPVVRVQFDAAYALFIHEDMEQKLKGKPRPSGIGVFWGPSGQPKYLESALNDKRAEIMELVSTEAKKR